MREGSSDDFQAQPGSAEKGTTITEKYKWDHAIEDLLCDLYEQYLEVRPYSFTAHGSPFVVFMSLLKVTGFFNFFLLPLSVPFVAVVGCAHKVFQRLTMVVGYLNRAWMSTKDHR